MATNQIRDVTFRPVPPARTVATRAGTRCSSRSTSPSRRGCSGSSEEVVTRFKHERMSGPPDARFLLITLAGDVSATDFAQAWQAQIANDAPARALLGTLHQADAMHTDAHGGVIGQASLLAS